MQKCLVRQPVETSSTKHIPLGNFMSWTPLFLALSLLGGLGDLAGSLVGLNDALDDTDGDGLTHVTGRN